MNWVLTVVLAILCAEPSRPLPSHGPLESVRSAATRFAGEILDYAVTASRSPEEQDDAVAWLEVLSPPSRGLPPELVVDAMADHEAFLRVAAGDDGFGHRVFDRVLQAARSAHARAGAELTAAAAVAPDRLPDMPEMFLRAGGAVVGGGRAIAAVGSDLSDDVRRAYEAWQEATLEAERLMAREWRLRTRLERVESRFTLFRDIFFHAGEARRAAIVRLLRDASQADGVDYLDMARLSPASVDQEGQTLQERPPNMAASRKPSASSDAHPR